MITLLTELRGPLCLLHSISRLAMLQHEKASTLSSYDVSTFQDLFLSPDKRPPKPQPVLPPEVQSLESKSTPVPEIASTETKRFDGLALQTPKPLPQSYKSAESKVEVPSRANHVAADGDHESTLDIKGSCASGNCKSSKDECVASIVTNDGESQSVVVNRSNGVKDGKNSTSSDDECRVPENGRTRYEVFGLVVTAPLPPVQSHSVAAVPMLAEPASVHMEETLNLPLAPSPAIQTSASSKRVTAEWDRLGSALPLEPSYGHAAPPTASSPSAQLPQASMAATTSAYSLKHWPVNSTTDLASEYFGASLLNRRDDDENLRRRPKASANASHDERAETEANKAHEPEKLERRDEEVNQEAIPWKTVDTGNQSLPAPKNGRSEVESAWRTVEAAEARAALMSRAEQELKTQGLRRALRNASAVHVQSSAPLNLSRSHEAAQLSNGYMDPIGDAPESPMSTSETRPRHQHCSDRSPSLDFVQGINESPDVSEAYPSKAPSESREGVETAETSAHGFASDVVRKTTATTTTPPQQLQAISPPPVPSSRERSHHSKARDRIREALHSSPGSSYAESQSSSSGSSRGYSTDCSNEARNLIRERLHSRKMPWNGNRRSDNQNHGRSNSSSSDSAVATENEGGTSNRSHNQIWVENGRIRGTQSPALTPERPTHSNVRTSERARAAFTPERSPQSANYYTPEKSTQSDGHAPERVAVIEHGSDDNVDDSDDGSDYTVDRDYSSGQCVVSTQYRMWEPYDRGSVDASSYLGAGSQLSHATPARNNAQVPMRSQFAARAAAAARAADCAQTSAAYARAAQAAAAEYRAAESAAPSPYRSVRSPSGKFGSQINPETSSFSRTSLEGVTTVTPGGSLCSYLVPPPATEQRLQWQQQTDLPPEFPRSWPWADPNSDMKVESSGKKATEKAPTPSSRADTEPLPHQSAWMWPPNDGHEREGLQFHQQDSNSEKTSRHSIETPPRPSALGEGAPLRDSPEYDDSALDALFSRVIKNHDELVAIGLGVPLQNRDSSWG